jgi:hypothetical protein
LLFDASQGTFRIDIWTAEGASTIEHIAGVEVAGGTGDLSDGGRALA